MKLNKKNPAAFHTLFPLRYFIETPTPEVHSDAWKKLNWSKYEFGVTNKDGLLLLTRGSKGNRCELKIPGVGKLVGTDKGEEKGNLVFKPLDANQPPVEIKKGNIRFIVKLDEEIYAFEAANLKGVMYHIQQNGDSFTFTQVLDFEDEPETYAIHNGTLLIASYQGFYKVNGLEKQDLVTDAFWFGLFPTSIAIIDPFHAYIGIRSGYVKLNLSNGKITFFRYDPTS